MASSTHHKSVSHSHGFVKREAIDFGFKVAKNNFFFFISIFVIVIFVNAILGYLTAGLSKQGPIIDFILTIVRAVVGIIISMGFLNISLKFADGTKPKITDIFYTKPFINYFLVSLVKTVIVAVGVVLLIIPGIIFGIRLQFATYLVIDKNMGISDALKKSWDMTRGKTINLFQFGILLFLVNLVGFLALIVGLLITIPLSMVATAYVYRKLS